MKEWVAVLFLQEGALIKMTGIFDWIMEASKNDWKKTARWLKINEEGILIGAAIACIVYFCNINIHIPIDDTGIARLAILIFLFSTAGALVDSVLPERIL